MRWAASQPAEPASNKRPPSLAGPILKFEFARKHEPLNQPSKQIKFAHTLLTNGENREETRAHLQRVAVSTPTESFMDFGCVAVFFCVFFYSAALSMHIFFFVRNL